MTLRQPVAEIILQSAADLAHKIKSGELSAVEVAQAHLDRIAEIDGEIHAFLYVDGERALATAARVDAKIAAGAEVGPLAGVPLALKDISETDPSATEYIVNWLFFSLVSLLPLAIALVLLAVARDRTVRMLRAARHWLELHARTVAAVLVVLLAVSLLRNGISGLTT